ncbi:hypothetical protein E3N88_25037 [Mikania micrantha]|uniref:Uncharacterized protein n=1 Tax=Mikania micrantha TaxID=192012 RepID=A0A5N6N3K6_9ASTR|nr:hypothetical protein E3N88_25037 [Mikania micrantha]
MTKLPLTLYHSCDKNPDLSSTSDLFHHLRPPPIPLITIFDLKNPYLNNPYPTKMMWSARDDDEVCEGGERGGGAEEEGDREGAAGTGLRFYWWWWIGEDEADSGSRRGEAAGSISRERGTIAEKARF